VTNRIQTKQKGDINQRYIDICVVCYWVISFIFL